MCPELVQRSGLLRPLNTFSFMVGQRFPWRPRHIRDISTIGRQGMHVQKKKGTRARGEKARKSGHIGFSFPPLQHDGQEMVEGRNYLGTEYSFLWGWKCDCSVYALKHTHKPFDPTQNTQVSSGHQGQAGRDRPNCRCGDGWKPILGG